MTAENAPAEGAPAGRAPAGRAPPPARCARHPEAPATHTCDGCRQGLCEDCVEVGHALLFCRLCGERALPLGLAAAAALSADSAPPQQDDDSYRLRDALAFPVRGRGRRIFPLTVLLTTGAALVPTVLPQLVMLIVASSLSMAIVRDTARGAVEPPLWPSPWELRERFADAATWIGARLLQLLFFAFLILQAGSDAIFQRPPSAVFWLVAALCLWLGTALGMVTLGAAGTFSRLQAANLLGHVRGITRLGVEGANATNLLFGLGALALYARSRLSAGAGLSDPGLAGDLLAGVVSAYWLLLEPHLAGLLFWRNGQLLTEAYGLAPDGTARVSP